MCGGGRWVVGVVSGAVHGGDAAERVVEMGMMVAVRLSDCLTPTCDMEIVDRDLLVAFFFFVIIFFFISKKKYNRLIIYTIYKS